jgi:hypothetical protein
MKADRKTAKVKEHITKNGIVNSGGRGTAVALVIGRTAAKAALQPMPRSGGQEFVKPFIIRDVRRGIIGADTLSRRN